MPRKSLLITLFYANLVLLIGFCVVFAMPFLANKVATEIVEMAGCSQATFDMPPKCPEGSVAERFAPLAGWPAVFLAPLFFVALFWDVVAFWILITAILGFFAFRDGQSLQSGRAPATAEDMK